MRGEPGGESPEFTSPIQPVPEINANIPGIETSQPKVEDKGWLKKLPGIGRFLSKGEPRAALEVEATLTDPTPVVETTPIASTVSDETQQKPEPIGSMKIGDIVVNHDTTPINVPSIESQQTKTPENVSTPDTSSTDIPKAATTEINSTKLDNGQPSSSAETPQEKPHAQPEQIQLTAEQQRLLTELRAKYPDNPLLDNDFKEVPENYRSVFIAVSEERFLMIKDYGLEPRKDDSTSVIPEFVSVNKIYDSTAPEGYSRSDSIYAYPTYEDTLTYEDQPGRIIIELKVDPLKVLVTDQEAFTNGVSRFNQTEHNSTGGNEEFYWEDAMTLENFLQLPDNVRLNTFNMPEVVIPGKRSANFMRVASILPQEAEIK